MTPEQSDSIETEYELKAIEYKDERAMGMSIILLKFDGESNPVLSSAGWGEDSLCAIRADGDLGYSTYDLRLFADRYENVSDDSLRRFLIAVKEGPLGWETVEDGKTYTRSELEELLEGNEPY